MDVKEEDKALLRRGSESMRDSTLAMFDGTRTGWKEWKLKVEGYMIGINERYQVALQEAERHPRGQALEVPAVYRELNRFLYGKLVERLMGTCLEVVLVEEGHQGFSSWRALCHEMERMVASRKPDKIEEFMTPKFDGTEEEFYGQWRKWEREVALNVNMI